MIRILIADDKKDLREAIEKVLMPLGYETFGVSDGEEAIVAARATHYDLAIVDLRMPRRDGLEVLRELRKISPTTCVILMTAYASMDTIIEALREEAVDYLLKPFSMNDLESRIQRVLERHNLVQKKILYPPEKSPDVHAGFVGHCPQMQKIRGLLKKVSGISSPILILGESGTGKELLAQEIHQFSERRHHPFVAINCATLSEGILESELFGHEKGSFTGAIAQKKGLFEMADRGTIFLDEIGELNTNTQVKLLRFLQEHEIQRVGSTKLITVNVRIIAATNKKLEEEVEAKRFRDDLWYRLNVLEIVLPPLRDRMEDLPLLVDHFLNKYRKILHKDATLSREALEALKNYTWPGNIRELENVIERALVLTAHNEVISLEELPARIIQRKDAITNQLQPASLSMSALPEDRQSLKVMEEAMIRKALGENAWNLSRTAEQLGMKRSTLQYKIQKLEIMKPLSNPS